MRRIRLVVAALLLASSGSQVAIAAEVPEHQSKNAHNVLVVLDSIGVNNQNVQQLVATLDTHAEGGYVTLADTTVNNGKLSLRYGMNANTVTAVAAGDTHRRFELNYAPKDSPMEYTMSTRSVMVNYHFEFNSH